MGVGLHENGEGGRPIREVSFKLRSERQLWGAREMVVSGRGRSCYKVLRRE